MNHLNETVDDRTYRPGLPPAAVVVNSVTADALQEISQERLAEKKAAFIEQATGNANRAVEKTFLFDWKEGYWSCLPETHPMSWASEDKGFDDDDKAVLDALPVGQTATLAGATTRLLATRVS